MTFGNPLTRRRQRHDIDNQSEQSFTPRLGVEGPPHAGSRREPESICPADPGNPP